MAQYSEYQLETFYDTYKNSSEGNKAFVHTRLLENVDAGNFDLAAVEFFDPDRGFTKAGGRKIQGLVNRRLRELDLWNRA